MQKFSKEFHAITKETKNPMNNYCNTRFRIFEMQFKEQVEVR